MIDARAFDSQTDAMPNAAGFYTYLDNTAGHSFIWPVSLSDAGKTEKFVQAARHAGRAFGVTGLMRMLPIHAARGKLFLLPAENIDCPRY